MTTRLLAILWLFALAMTGQVKAASDNNDKHVHHNDPLIIPNEQQYADFLLEPYKPGKPSIVAFKDPHCGYCIKALKRLDRLSEYNVYMFWAGILGKRSEQTVEQILACAAPISSEVFESVVRRSPVIVCQSGDKARVEQLAELNNKMVQNYHPHSVPSYFFGGRKVYVSQLEKFKRSMQMNVTPIQLQWQRYADLRVDNTNHNGLANAIVFLPPNSPKRSHILKALAKETKYSWHLVEAGCENGAKCSKKQKLSQELKLLMDLSDDDLVAGATVINGTVINPKRYRQYFSTGLATMLASK